MKIGIDARMYGTKLATGIGNYVKHITDYVFEQDNQNEYYLFLLPEIYNQYQPPATNIKPIKADFHWYTWAEQTKYLKLLFQPQCLFLGHSCYAVPIRAG